MKRDRLHKARPSYKIHELVNRRIERWQDSNAHSRKRGYPEISSFYDYYFWDYGFRDI